MAFFQPTDDDIKGVRKVTAGWKTLQVVDIVESATKNDPTATNIILTAKIVGGEDDGVSIRKWFYQGNDIGRQSTAAFLQCFTPDGKLEKQRYNLDDLKGLSFDGYCRFNIDRNWNEITEFAPHKAAAGAR